MQGDLRASNCLLYICETMAIKKILLLVVQIFLCTCTHLYACSCSSAWNDTFLRTARSNEYVALVKVLSFDAFLNDEFKRGHEEKIPYSMTVEVIRNYKGFTEGEKIIIYGDNGILCRPYLNVFELDAYYLIAPIQYEYEGEQSFSFFICRTDYLKVNKSSNTVVGNYSFLRNSASLATFNWQIKYGPWDVEFLILVLLLIIGIYVIKRRKAQKLI